MLVVLGQAGGTHLYLTVTSGMTSQVSDTNITARCVRRATLRHALLSDVFAAVIIAIAINLVAGLLRP